MLLPKGLQNDARSSRARVEHFRNHLQKGQLREKRNHCSNNLHKKQTQRQAIT